jgi:hypothetical protein
MEVGGNPQKDVTSDLLEFFAFWAEQKSNLIEIKK